MFKYDGNGYRNRQDVLDAIENRHKWLETHESTAEKGKGATTHPKRRKSSPIKPEEASNAD